MSDHQDLSDSDFVDRVFDYLQAEFPELATLKLQRARDAVRHEFAGGRAYIPTRTPADRQQLAEQILALFNGRNASEVARRLGIGRATVYRHLKQARSANRLSLGGNETPRRLRSATSTAKPRHTQEPATWPSPQTTSPPSTPPSPAANSPSATTDAPSPTAA